MKKHIPGLQITCSFRQLLIKKNQKTVFYFLLQVTICLLIFTALPQILGYRNFGKPFLNLSCVDPETPCLEGMPANNYFNFYTQISIRSQLNLGPLGLPLKFLFKVISHEKMFHFLPQQLSNPKTYLGAVSQSSNPIYFIYLLVNIRSDRLQQL